MCEVGLRHDMIADPLRSEPITSQPEFIRPKVETRKPILSCKLGPIPPHRLVRRRPWLRPLIPAQSVALATISVPPLVSLPFALLAGLAHRAR